MFRKSTKKKSYQMFKDDPPVSDITMNEDSRIELMLKVKQGQLTQDEAIEQVKAYEKTNKLVKSVRKLSLPFLDKDKHDEKTKAKAQRRASYAPFKKNKQSSFQPEIIHVVPSELQSDITSTTTNQASSSIVSSNNSRSASTETLIPHDVSDDVTDKAPHLSKKAHSSKKSSRLPLAKARRRSASSIGDGRCPNVTRKAAFITKPGRPRQSSSGSRKSLTSSEGSTIRRSDTSVSDSESVESSSRTSAEATRAEKYTSDSENNRALTGIGFREKPSSVRRSKTSLPYTSSAFVRLSRAVGRNSGVDNVVYEPDTCSKQVLLLQRIQCGTGDVKNQQPKPLSYRLLKAYDSPRLSVIQTDRSSKVLKPIRTTVYTNKSPLHSSWVDVTYSDSENIESSTPKRKVTLSESSKKIQKQNASLQNKVRRSQTVTEADSIDMSNSRHGAHTKQHQYNTTHTASATTTTTPTATTHRDHHHPHQHHHQHHTRSPSLASPVTRRRNQLRNTTCEVRTSRSHSLPRTECQRRRHGGMEEWLAQNEHISRLNLTNGPMNESVFTVDNCRMRMHSDSSQTASQSRSSISRKFLGLGRNFRKKFIQLKKKNSSKDSDSSFPSGLDDFESLEDGDDEVLVDDISSGITDSCSGSDIITVYDGPYVGRARVIKDYTPTPYDAELLTIKKGQVINVINKSQTGLWEGVVDNKIGKFKFINVEMLTGGGSGSCSGVTDSSCDEESDRSLPRHSTVHGVPELLTKVKLKGLIPLFQIHGYETLEHLSQLRAEDLDELQITDEHQRTTLLTLAQVLSDYELAALEACGETTEQDGRALKTYSTSNAKLNGNVRAPGQLPRDSGCYASTETLQQPLQLCASTAGPTVENTSQEDRSKTYEEDGQEGTGKTKDNVEKCTVSEKDPDNVPKCEPPRCHGAQRRRVLSGDHDYVNAPYVNIDLAKLSEKYRVGKADSCAQTALSMSAAAKCKELYPSKTRSSSRLPYGHVYSSSNPCSESSDGATSDGSDSSCRRSISGKLKAHVDMYMSSSPMQMSPVSPSSSGRSTPSCQRSGSPLSQSGTSNLGQILTSPQRRSGSLLTGGGQSSRRTPSIPRRALESQTKPKSLIPTKAVVKTTSLGRSISSRSPKPRVRRRSAPGVTSESAPSSPQNTRSSATTQKNSTAHRPLSAKLPGESSPRHHTRDARQGKAVCRHESFVLSEHERTETVCPQDKIDAKLCDENVDLTKVPYTDKCGFCGIPPSLVQRYAEELSLPIPEVAAVLDDTRIKCLQQQGRVAVPNDFLGESSMCPVRDVDMSSVSDFLTSVGLPMYIPPLIKDGGYRSILTVKNMKEADWRRYGVTNPAHLRRLVKATELLALKFGIKAKQMCVPQTNQTPITEIRDKV